MAGMDRMDKIDTLDNDNPKAQGIPAATQPHDQMAG
jgi:hypothetical protein